MTHSLVVSPSIRHARIEGLQVILDLRTERYRVLDEIGTRFWAVLTGVRVREEAYVELTAEFDVATSDLDAAFKQFEVQCIDTGLLEPDARSEPDALATPPRRRALRPRARIAWIALWSTRACLVRHGFAATYRRYAAAPLGAEPCPASEAIRAFKRAELLFVSRRAPRDCVTRSLALFSFMRSVGLPAEHVIGVRRTGFNAHAWVELAGNPVLNESVAGYVPLARMGAGQ